MTPSPLVPRGAWGPSPILQEGAGALPRSLPALLMAGRRPANHPAPPSAPLCLCVGFSSPPFALPACPFSLLRASARPTRHSSLVSRLSSHDLP